MLREKAKAACAKGNPLKLTWSKLPYKMMMGLGLTFYHNPSIRPYNRLLTWFPRHDVPDVTWRPMCQQHSVHRNLKTIHSVRGHIFMGTLFTLIQRDTKKETTICWASPFDTCSCNGGSRITASPKLEAVLLLRASH